MKWLIHFLIIIALYITPVSAQQSATHFQLYAPSLPDTASVYITGSVAQLGNWNPGKVKLSFQANHTWEIRLELDRSGPIEYKYTLGSWDQEAVYADGRAFVNFKVRESIWDTVRFWKSNKSKPGGQVTGILKYHRGLKYGQLRERDVVVWLPPGYENSTRRYPVIYMQDGQNVFDPATSSFGTDWQIDEAADSLIRHGITEPVIIVGIYNTADRSKEYIPGETGKAYMDLVVRRIKPFIDSAYHTKTGRKHAIAGGSSAGGILSFMLVWEYPHIFSRAICMSPAFKLPNANAWNYIKTVQGDKKRPKVFFYMDNGGLGLEKLLQPGIDEMLSVLKSKGYKEGRQFVFISDASAEHNEQAWAKRFPGAMRWIFSR